MENEIRVRIAPSPTGAIHVGNVRTALFNWLFARKNGGKFILRIEDTDVARSKREYEEIIFNEFKWLGLNWDEGPDIGGPYGPYRQTDRFDIYASYAQELLEKGYVYRCYCTQEELDKEREEMLARGEMPRYGGRCCNLTPEQEQALIAEGRKPSLRFRVPKNETVVVDDLVHGRVEFDTNTIGDFVIVRPDGVPVYNFVVVIDDHLMKISHIIRAEEHLSNTPRQILLYKALGFPLPKFAHASMILGPDRTKLSKRHGATFIGEYREQGYLPEALVNFLALLGWSPEGEQEIFSIEELSKQFTLERLAKNPAVFDLDKLRWINSQYLKKASLEQITEMALPHLRKAGYIGDEVTAEQYAWLKQVVDAVRDHLSYVAEIVNYVDVFFNDNVVLADEEARAILCEGQVPGVIEAFEAKLRSLPELTVEEVQPALKALVKELKLPGKKVLLPIRIALTGQKSGPELYNLIPILGLERTLKRIKTTMAGLKG